MKKIAITLASLLFVYCTFVACGSDAGAVIVALQTDLNVTKDIDAIGIGVKAGDTPIYSNLFAIGASSGQQPLPATLAIAEGKTQGVTVTIRAVAFKGSKARVIRDVVTTVPHQRIVTLRLPLQFLSLDDSVTGALTPAQVAMEAVASPTTESTTIHLDDNGGSDGLPDWFTDFDSACSLAQGNTRIDGSCVSATTDSASLPGYDPTALFGAGGPGSAQACFDMQGCCGHATSTVLDKTTCTFPANAATPFNVAMHAANGAGFCVTTGCLVPLDFDPSHGFSIDAQNLVHLPIGVCTSPNVADVMIDYGDCPDKLTTLPIDGAGVDCLPDDGDGDGGSDATAPADGSGVDSGDAGGPNVYPGAAEGLGATADGDYVLFFSNNTLSLLSFDPTGAGSFSSNAFGPVQTLNAGRMATDATDISLVVYPPTTTAYEATYTDTTKSTSVGGAIGLSTPGGQLLYGSFYYGGNVFFASNALLEILYAPTPIVGTSTMQTVGGSTNTDTYPTAFATDATASTLYAAYWDGTQTTFVNLGATPATAPSFTNIIGNASGLVQSMLIAEVAGHDGQLVAIVSNTDGTTGSVIAIDLVTHQTQMLDSGKMIGSTLSTFPKSIAQDASGNVYYAASPGTIYQTPVFGGSPTAFVSSPAAAGATTVVYASSFLYFDVNGGAENVGVSRVPVP